MSSGLPFYDYLLSTNSHLLGNMLFQDSPGHMIQELDNFLRMRHLGEVDPRCNYLAVFPQGPTKIPNYIAAALPGIFSKDNRLQIVVDDNLFKLSCDIQAMRPDLTVDVGVSHFKISLPEGVAKSSARLMHLPGAVRSLYWVLAHEAINDCILEHSRRWAKSRDFRPWQAIGELTPELTNFLGGKPEKLALIHISDKTQNARVKTEPESLIPTLEYLRDNGFTVVKMGWENFPECWKRYDVLNYRESRLLSYGNDLLLLKAASFAMFNGSGADFLSNLLETPMVSYGGWIMNNMRTSPNCVHLPSLMIRKDTGRALTFVEQLRFFDRNLQYWEKGNCLNFPDDQYDVLQPTPELLLAAAIEAIELGANWTPRTPEQTRFIELDKRRHFAYTESRACQKLLEKYPDSIATGFCV